MDEGIRQIDPTGDCAPRAATAETRSLPTEGREA